jgi:hypothetical protein
MYAFIGFLLGLFFDTEGGGVAAWIVVDKVTLRQYFGFPCHLSFQRLFHTRLSFGVSTAGQCQTYQVDCLTSTTNANKLYTCQPASDYTDRAAATCRRSYCHLLRV